MMMEPSGICKRTRRGDAATEDPMKGTRETAGQSDDEDTLPPLIYPNERATTSRPPRPRATGDFKVTQTIVAASHTPNRFEVRLIAKLGWDAYFGFDDEVGGRIARELQRQLTSSYPRLFLVSRPPELPIAPLTPGDPPVRFAASDAPEIDVTKEKDGDRIVVTVLSERALLNISLEAGVAITLFDILTDFAPLAQPMAG
jgi:hypothetical protein